MRFAIENEDSTFKNRILTSGNIEWDATHYCPASALTEAEREAFRVVDFAEVQPPTTGRWQAVREADPVKADGVWTQQWEVVSAFSDYTDEAGVVHTAAEQEVAAARKAKNDEINAEREKRTFDTFTHAGKVISCDTLSRSDIDGANGYIALNGAFPDIWPGAWKCADNTYLTITTVDEWKAFYGSMVAAGSALYAHAQELKAALADATTAEEIAAIVW